MNRKEQHMEQLAQWREHLFREPQLRNLFIELTLDCNLHCLHCGSNCGDLRWDPLTSEDYLRFLDKVAKDFDVSKINLNITGGEPLLNPDFFVIMNHANELGYRWGMTTNGTLIDAETARRLREAGMRTVGISLDGLRETHDWFRQTPGSFDAALQGIQCLIDEDWLQAIQVSTVVHHQNIGELDQLFELFQDIDIDSWRLIPMDPIGRAKEQPELMLSDEDYQKIFRYVMEKRLAGEPVECGCPHYLGINYERTVRDWYYLCAAGIYTASLMANGDIGACLDIERNELTIQGNLRFDDFTDVWKNRFQLFRREKAGDNPECAVCTSRRFCDGGSCHTWDFEKKQQAVCMKGILF